MEADTIFQVGSIAWSVTAAPYLMVSSVFPGVSDWGARVPGAAAVVLVTSALVPSKEKTRDYQT